MSTDDPHLSRLFVDQDEVDTERLAQALTGLVGIDKATGGLVFGDDFHTLTNDAKVVAVLLGTLAASILERRDSQSASVGEVVAITALPQGSIGPALRSMATKKRLVNQDSDRRYYISRAKVSAAIEFVTRIRQERPRKT